MAKTYFEKLKDPRWQRKRLKVLDAYGFQCSMCLCKDRQLHVHHNAYLKDKEPWDYELTQYSILCEDCHEATHSNGDIVKIISTYIPAHKKREIAYLIAGYLELDKEIVYKAEDGEEDDYNKSAYQAGVNAYSEYVDLIYEEYNKAKKV